MKTFKDFLLKLNEEAPVNAAGGGNVAGIGVGPNGEPGMKRKPKVLTRGIKWSKNKSYQKS